MADATELPSVVDFSMDLSKQEQPDPMPSGQYTGIIRGAIQRLSARETRYAEVAFFINADQYPADWEDGNPEGTTLFYRRCGLEDNPSARFNARRFIEAIGAPLGKKVNLDDWIGLEAVLDIGPETYEGVKRAVIVKVSAV